MNEPTGTEAAVCADIAARQRAGIAKYGTTVADNPLTRRQWLQHAYEEALDLAVYLKRLMTMNEKTNETVDTQRLDWLAEHFYTHSFRFTRGFPTMNNSQPPGWTFWSPNEGTTSRPTLREAIDEAMRPAENKLQPLTKNDQWNQ